MRLKRSILGRFEMRLKRWWRGRKTPPNTWSHTTHISMALQPRNGTERCFKFGGSYFENQKWHFFDFELKKQTVPSMHPCQTHLQVSSAASCGGERTRRSAQMRSEKGWRKNLIAPPWWIVLTASEGADSGPGATFGNTYKLTRIASTLAS